MTDPSGNDVRPTHSLQVPPSSNVGARRWTGRRFRLRLLITLAVAVWSLYPAIPSASHPIDNADLPVMDPPVMVDAPPPAALPIAGTCGPAESAECRDKNSEGDIFREVFNGAPTEPVSVVNSLDRWYAQPTNNRLFANQYRPTPMQADHGSDCSPPPGSHRIDTYEQSIYLCKDHLMTAMNPGDEEAGVVTLQPNHLVDLSKQEAVVKVDVSTFSPSAGDWWEIWITPWEDQLVAPADHWLNFAGPPRNALYFAVRELDGRKFWSSTVFSNFRSVLPGATCADCATGVEFWESPEITDLVPRSNTRKDTYEIRLTKQHVKMLVRSIADGSMKVVDEFDIPGGFPADAGIVQFIGASYNANQNGKFNCTPFVTCPRTPSATWHWDNVEISPAVPYSLIAVEPFLVRGESPSKEIVFSEEAPRNARLLFTGLSAGNVFELSFDGGSTWQKSSLVQPHPPVGDEVCGGGVDCITQNLSYTINVPAGTKGAIVRASAWCTGGCIGGAPITWWATNFHVVSRLGVQPTK